MNQQQTVLHFLNRDQGRLWLAPLVLFLFAVRGLLLFRKRHYAVAPFVYTTH
jgi:hypothetical protein